ncbi:MAG: YjdF family protein, partial [Spirochaetes bacterium]|nr:YjdF family protein [Spirochaetota bacterium]
MENSTCTVFFDGRFWIALAVRTDEAGVASIARHVFGPEPTNPELLRFYLFVLPALRYLPGLPAP